MNYNNNYDIFHIKSAKNLSSKKMSKVEQQLEQFKESFKCNYNSGIKSELLNKCLKSSQKPILSITKD